MLDILHVLFEEDLTPTWEQDGQVKSKIREFIYQNLYNSEYKYSYSSEPRIGTWDPEIGGLPEEKSHKPYIPPTDETELFDILGSPMGE